MKMLVIAALGSSSWPCFDKNELSTKEKLQMDKQLRLVATIYPITENIQGGHMTALELT